MNFIKSIKDKIFGCPEDPPPPPQRFQQENDDCDFNSPHGSDFGFRIFSNPLEMHRYFERQMDGIFKSLSITDQDFPGNSPFFGTQTPPINDTPNTGSLRYQYLRPGFEKPQGNHRSDQIIDGHVDVGELDAVIKPEEGNRVGKTKPQFKGHFFGHSMSSKVVTKLDGTTEIHRTVRDSQGNEESTVTKKIGDKEYTVTTKTDSTGQQEIHETMVNIDDNELEFFKNPVIDNKDLPNIMNDNDKNIFDKLFGSKM